MRVGDVVYLIDLEDEKVYNTCYCNSIMARKKYIRISRIVLSTTPTRYYDEDGYWYVDEMFLKCDNKIIKKRCL